MSRDVRVAILGDSRDFSRAVRDARSDADRLDGTFSRVGRSASNMGRVFAGIAAGGVLAGGAAVAGFLRAAEESQQVTRQTQAVIRSMGGASNVTAQQVSRLSTRLSLMSGIDDELIQGGQNVLLTFGRVRNEMGAGNNIFDRATEAALNMSVALGTDLNGAAMMVGKALNDPIRGLTALRRSGIQFSDSQERTIRTMVEQNNVAGAQRVMLEELERQFGGSAEAQATASDKLRVAWGNIQEQIGAALLPAFEAAATWLTERLPGAMTWAGGFVDGLKEKWETFTSFLFGSDTDWDSFWDNVALGAATFAGLWNDYIDDVDRGWTEFTDRVFGSETDWDSFWQDVERGWQDVQTKWDLFTDDIVRGWQQAMSDIDELTGPFLSSLDFAADKIGALAGMIYDVFDNPNPFGQGDSGGTLQDLINLVDGKPPETGGSWTSWLGNKPPPAKPPISPISGPFADGGIMPGPRGKHALALVAGGETILPTHKSGFDAGGLSIGNLSVGSTRDLAVVKWELGRIADTAWRVN